MVKGVKSDRDVAGETPASASSEPSDQEIRGMDASDVRISDTGTDAAPLPDAGTAEENGTTPAGESTEMSSTSDPDASGSSASPAAEYAASASMEPSRTPPSGRAPSLSGLVAAGMFGGLVALAGAGSIQYAGFIPNFGPAAQPAAAVDAAEIAALRSDLASVTDKIGAAPDLTPLETRLAALESTVAAVAEKAAAASAAPSDAISKELGDRLTKMDADLAETKAALAAAEQKMASSSSDTNLGKAIAASALKGAIDRGGPFGTELETLATLAADDPVIAKLQPYAKTGVLARAQLVKMVPETADAILRAVDQPSADASMTDRLLHSALSVIKVRPVGNVEGEGPAAIVARMEERLQNGDLAGAAAQWETLPEVAKTVSKDFKAALDARINVEALMGEVMAHAMAGRAVKG
ncbi:MAG: hypothetical protein RIR97_1799 [Pseudomonadota bacterium]